jgi:hypothetical protein
MQCIRCNKEIPEPTVLKVNFKLCANCWLIESGLKQYVESKNGREHLNQVLQSIGFKIYAM